MQYFDTDFYQYYQTRSIWWKSVGTLDCLLTFTAKVYESFLNEEFSVAAFVHSPAPLPTCVMGTWYTQSRYVYLVITDTR